MGDKKNFLEMLVKAPTLFTYSTYKWGTKIDPHKMFCTCILQLFLLIILCVVYATTPGMSYVGLSIFIGAIWFAALIDYVYILGAPRNKAYWKYILTGKVSEELKQKVDQYQPQQNVAIVQQPMEESKEPEYVEAEQPNNLTEKELQDMVDKIVIDDTDAVVEESVEEIDAYSILMNSLGHEEHAEEDLTTEVKEEQQVVEQIVEEVKQEVNVEQVQVEEPPKQPVVEEPVVLDMHTEDAMMDNIIATSSLGGVKKNDIPNFHVDMGAGIDDEDEL